MFLCTEQVLTGLLACIRVGGHWKVCCLLPRGRGRALDVAEQGPVRAPSDSILPRPGWDVEGGLEDASEVDCPLCQPAEKLASGLAWGRLSSVLS